MIRIFYGDNRQGIEGQVRKILGEGYEVYEGEGLEATDLPGIFLGATLFEVEGRRILLKNLSEKAGLLAEVAKYVNTEHTVVIWEPKIDKRSAEYKALGAAGVEMTEMKTAAGYGSREVFGVLNLALRDGVAAVRQMESIQSTEDPFAVVALMGSQALRKFGGGGDAREVRVLKELAELDLQMKTVTTEPWLLVKSFLLRVGS